MRPDIGAYDETSFFHTPNLDQLATKSLLLKHAYVQQAVCSPSRTSLLTGRRPDTTHVHDLIQYWRNVGGNFTTIPQYFKEQGYRTAGFGKIFHPGKASGHNDPISWTDKYYLPDRKYWNERTDLSWFPASQDEIDKHPLPDMQTADHAIEFLKKYSNQPTANRKPFFAAVGFHKPHLPFIFPDSFLDFYPREKIVFPKNNYAPVDMPEVAWSNFDELRKYSDIGMKYGHGCINSTIPKDVVITLRRAYYASISYIDSLVGNILSSLQSLGLAQDTIVSFWGDHGWQLGEHGEWCKHTNFEAATRAPMMLHVPNMTLIPLTTDALVEFVDLFPTLVEAAGLPPLIRCPEKSSTILLCTEGLSFFSLLKNPARKWKQAAFSQYPRMIVSGNVLMGYSLRTDKFRFTAWVVYDTENYEPLWSGPKQFEELYDHSIDPDENHNVAASTKYSSIRKELRKLLEEGWRKALPPDITVNDSV